MPRTSSPLTKTASLRLSPAASLCTDSVPLGRRIRTVTLT
jgi:hypothetical protein